MGPPLFQFGKLIAIAGIILVAVGTLLMAGSRLGLLGSIGRMPGAIAYKYRPGSYAGHLSVPSL
jgi:hypothetical protein